MHKWGITDMTSKTNDSYVKATPENPVLPNTVFQAEFEAIKTRREKMGIQPANESNSDKGPLVTRGLVGLALSGGGIRSSTFNLGVLQALDRVGLLRHVDYLSTVSGGGYIGSCLSSFFSGEPDTKVNEIELSITPECGNLSKGQHLGNGQWKLKADELGGLCLTLPKLNSQKIYKTTVKAIPVKKDAAQPEEISLPMSIGSKKVNGLSIKTSRNEKEENILEIDGNPDEDEASLNLFIGTRPFPFPFRHYPGKQESKAFKHLRDYSNYLTPPRSFATLRLPGLFLRGLLINALILLPLLLVAAVGTLFLYKSNIRDALNTRQFQYIIDEDLMETKGKPGEYRKIEIDLQSRIQWDPNGKEKYISLSGLPKNSYSKKGIFLDKGRWLFTGETAEDLKLNLLIPDLNKIFKVKIRAWQSSDDVYQVKHQPKQIKTLSFTDTPPKKRVQVKNWSTLADLNRNINSMKKSPGFLFDKKKMHFHELLNGVMNWGNEAGTPHLLILNWPENIPLKYGRHLRGDQWIFDGDEIKEILWDDLKDVKALQIIVWKSGKGAAVLDPVSRIYQNTFQITKWLLLVFVIALALYPLIQSIMGACYHVPLWRQRDILSRYLCGAGIAGIVMVAFFEIQPVAIYLFYHIHDTFDMAGIFGGVDKCLTVLGSLMSVLGGLFASRAMNRKSGMVAKLSLYFLGIVGPFVLWLFYLNFCSWAIKPSMAPEFFRHFGAYLSPKGLSIPGPYTLIPVYLVVAVVLYFISRRFYNVNKTSLHPFYRDRLSKAFLFTKAKTDHGDVAHNDEQQLHKLNRECAPYHIINTTLNIQGKKEANLQGRNAEFFMISREYVGSRVTGYYKTKEYENSDNHMGLATAMTISAAAVAPNMGRASIRSLTFIMALFNLRLGYWALNPLQIPPENKGGLTTKVGPIYLLKEMMGRINEKSDYINLSDGGHLENMGLYELVRRRCKFIIVCDAEADKDMSFKGMADAIRMIRIDMGIDIEIKLDNIRNAEGHETGHYAVGTIDYRGEGEGYLLYIKSSVSGDENVYIKDYKIRNSDFPHESTTDQFFDEAQFEAYRALGNHVGRGAFNDIQGNGFLHKIERSYHAV